MKLAIIPARGGSKRIPRKNIRLFAGRPIIAYSIEAALEASLFDRVIVSTDDEEIANIGRELGADVPFVRPAALANDFAGTNAVVKHAISWCHEQRKSVEFACCIYATAPFVRVRDLREAFEKLERSEKSYVFAVTTYPFPIQRAICLNSMGEVEPLFPEHVNSRSQDLAPAFHDAGQFYWGRARAFLEEVATFSREALPMLVPRHLVQDIDTMEDWERAELMFRAWTLAGGAGA